MVLGGGGEGADGGNLTLTTLSRSGGGGIDGIKTTELNDR